MLYMIEMKVRDGLREVAIQEFESRGPNRIPGVKFRGAWIKSQEDSVYALVEGADKDSVKNAAQSWSEFFDSTIHPVIDIENY